VNELRQVGGAEYLILPHSKNGPKFANANAYFFLGLPFLGTASAPDFCAVYF